MLCWSKFGREETLRCNVEVNGVEYDITLIVGKIKPKNDGRWNWWIYTDRNFSNPHIKADEVKQGTVGTREEAIKKVEENYV